MEKKWWKKIEKYVDKLVEKGQQVAVLRFNSRAKAIDFRGTSNLKKFVEDGSVMEKFIDAASGSYGVQMPSKEIVPVGLPALAPEEINLPNLRKVVGNLVGAYVYNKYGIVRGFWGIERLTPEWYPKDVPFVSPNDNKRKEDRLKREECVKVINSYKAFVLSGKCSSKNSSSHHKQETYFTEKMDVDEPGLAEREDKTDAEEIRPEPVLEDPKKEKEKVELHEPSVKDSKANVHEPGLAEREDKTDAELQLGAGAVLGKPPSVVHFIKYTPGLAQSAVNVLLCAALWSWFYADDGEDIVLIYSKRNDKFYALGAVCSHEGGPLEQGDIEDFDGREKIVCPWHSYDFDLETGDSSYGLKQDVYEVCVREDQVYIYTASEMSTKPFKKPIIPKDTEKNDKAVEEKNEDTGSLTYWASKILNTACPQQKVELTHKVGEMWRNGDLTVGVHHHPPDQPARDKDLTVVKPGKERKRGKGISLASRISNLHSMANIEQWAIDLSWDIIARFSSATPEGSDEALPRGFYDDFVQVACEEAKHYKLLSDRLQDLGSHFGALPVHGALWDSATKTSDSLLARLAVVHMVFEARGLDVQPKTLEKFAKNNDPESAAILEIIFREEITHVAAGLRWFSWVCNHSNPPMDCIPTFHKLVQQYYGSYLKPPFNTESRSMAGMTEEWYLPLVKPTS